ncbi:MAG: redox-sensing transcriptional repressor Rex [Gordonia sp. (in: high G+C Gram-positive bacteria)]
MTTGERRDAGRSVGPVSGDIPEPTVARLASYLYVLRSCAHRGTLIASSEQIATAAGVNPAILRKDLSYVGASGVRGVGYDIGKLMARLSIVLHVDRTQTVALAGAGRFGQALLAHAGIGRGLRVAAMFDDDPAVIGQALVPGAPVVAPLHMIIPTCTDPQVGPVEVGVVATDDDQAQQVADAFTAAGVRRLLNVTPVTLRTESAVIVRQVDLALELQILAFHASRGPVGAGDDSGLRGSGGPVGEEIVAR